MVGTRSSGNYRPKEHGLQLFLIPELQQALAKLQVDRNLGRCYAGLLAITEGFYKCGCIDKEVYEALKERYSTPIVCSVVAERAKPRTSGEAEEQNRIRKLEAEFSNVIAQWASMSTKNHLLYMKKAGEFKDRVPNAKLVLALAAEEGGPVRQETLPGMT